MPAFCLPRPRPQRNPPDGSVNHRHRARNQRAPHVAPLLERMSKAVEFLKDDLTAVVKAGVSVNPDTRQMGCQPEHAGCDHVAKTGGFTRLNSRIGEVGPCILTLPNPLDPAGLSPFCSAIETVKVSTFTVSETELAHACSRLVGHCLQSGELQHRRTGRESPWWSISSGARPSIRGIGGRFTRQLSSAAVFADNTP